MKKATKLTPVQRRAIVTKSIEKIYDSLQSHLESATEQPTQCPHCGSRKFHADCVREYAEVIADLAKLL